MPVTAQKIVSSGKFDAVICLGAIIRGATPHFEYVASEAAKLSRLHWWTVEYGLYGTPEDFSIYGAGLLSSVGESQACLKPEVKKIPLSVDCVNQNYDITTMQPQLYVNRDWKHLKDVLNEFSQTMSYKTGGLNSLQLALESENVATFVLY